MADLPPTLAWAGREGGEAAPAPLRLGDEEVAAAIGWGGLEIRDGEVDLLDLCAAHARALRDFSCGQCVPCREGSRVLAGLLEAARTSRGGDALLAQARRVAETMEQTSRCDLGRTSPAAIRSALERLAGLPRADAAPEEARRFGYRSILTAPCIQACPLHIDVPRYVEHIRNGRFREALATIEERLPFAGVVGRVCVKPCESQCRRGLLDEPIQIRHLKRFAADSARELAKSAAPPAHGAQGDPARRCDSEHAVSRAAGPASGPRPRAPGSGGRAAVIGAGPAGLTCAKVLAAHGHPVTVFERLPAPGGMLSATIPSYRLPVDVLEEEVKAIERAGVEIAYGKALGRDFTLGDLERQGFRAVFLAVGTHRATAIDLEGDRAAEGVWDCLDFLARAKAGEEVPVGKTVLVLGGGNVAIDVARTARRLGAADVRIVYRRTRRQMRAHSWEIEEALEEGITVEERWAPKRIVASEGRVLALEVRRSVVDSARGADVARGADAARGAPGFDDSECKVFEADTVVFAIGVAVDASFRKGVEGLELHPDGRVKADPLTLRTSVAGVFAGGDCVTGPNIAVQACAHGLVAGLQMAHYLATGEVADPDEPREAGLVGQLRPYDPGEKVALPRGDGRVAIGQLEMPERTRGFREIERGFTAEEAVAEASRCLRCYRVVTCAYRA